MNSTPISCRVVFGSLLLTLCLHLSLYTQVIIKDTVVISPGQTIEPETFPLPTITIDSLLNPTQFGEGGTVPTVLRFELSWTPHVLVGVSAYFSQAACYGPFVVNDTVPNQSPLNYSFIVPCPGIYRVRPHVCGPFPGQFVTFTWRIFLNDSLVTDTSVVGFIVDCCGGSRCIVDEAEIDYNYPTPEHTRFETVAGEDTLGSGDTTQVKATALDTQDREVWIDPATLLTYRIQPDTLGRFINAAGDTVPSPLNNVPYQDARAGRVRFLANSIPPDSLRAVTIEVLQMNDTTKRGNDTVWIENPVYVKITRPDSVNVYPTYPLHNDSTTKKNWMDLELKTFTADSTPIPNYWVRVDTPVVVDSGGHSHSHTSPRRPVGKFHYPTTSSVAKDTLLAQTDNTGKLRFRYVASQFGGRERITARLASDTTKFDTLSLITRVPGLELLLDGTNYDLIGGTCRHHGPGGTGGCATPDNNHWAGGVVVESLTSIADQWASLFPNEPRLFINDISLPLGGGFDVIGGLWEADLVPGRGHQTHRDPLYPSAGTVSWIAKMGFSVL